MWILAFLAALPALAAAVGAVGSEWVPVADHAPIEVRVRDVTTSQPPLVGVFSRVGGNHPGPVLFYVLAGPYRLLGSQPWALLVGAGLINATWMATAVLVAGRRRRLGLAAATATLVLVCAWRLGPDVLRDPWNPNLALFAFLTAALAAWAVACGSYRCLPVAAVAMTFCLQAHVGYLLLIAVLVGWCGVGVWSARDRLRSWRPSLLLALVLLVVLWAPVVGQQAFGAEGNLGAIVRNAGDADGASLGAAGAADRLLPELGPSPTWPRPDPDFPLELHRGLGTTWPPVGLVVFLGATAVAIGARRRGGDRDPLVLIGVTASLWIAGAVSLTRISGLPFAYLFRWVRVLGLLLWLAALWPLAVAAAGRVLPERPDEQRRRAVTGALLALIATGAVAVSAGQLRTPFADDPLQLGGRLLAEEAVRAASDRVAPGSTVEVRPTGAVVFVAPAAVAALERAGFGVVTGTEEGNVWGRHRLSGAGDADLVLVVTSAGGQGPLGVEEDLDVAATIDLLTPGERREWEELGPEPPTCPDLMADAVESAASEVGDDPALAECRRHATLRFRAEPITILAGR